MFSVRRLIYSSTNTIQHWLRMAPKYPKISLRGTNPKQHPQKMFRVIAILSSCLPGPLWRASGYEGTEDMYFSSRELITAYETEGLALDYWTGCWANFPVAPAFCTFCTVWVFAVLHCFGILPLDLSRSCLQGFDATWKQPGKLGKRANHACGAQTAGKNLKTIANHC